MRKPEPKPVVPFYQDKYFVIPRPPFRAHQRGVIDVRHLCLLRSILGYGEFQRGIEIGCFEGYSTMALLDAQFDEEVRVIDVVDLNIPDYLKQLFHLRDRNAFEGPSTDYLEMRTGNAEGCVMDDWSKDFIFVDGCHLRAVVSEEVRMLLKVRPLVVMAHDTNSQACGLHGCDGPPLLKAAFQQHEDYFCLEDNRVRAGETTEKGMFFATRSQALFAYAKRQFEFWDDAFIDEKFLSRYLP